MLKNSSQKYMLYTFYGVVVAVVCLIAASGFILQSTVQTTDNRSQASTNSELFVQSNGTQFSLGGKEFKFIGFNLFDAAGAGNSPYSCLGQTGWWPKFTDAEIDTALKTMKRDSGATVLRFWAFQKYTKGGTDWSGIDKVIQVAKRNGFKVMPVLEDGPGYCTEPGGGGNAHVERWKYNQDTWYTEGYKVVNSPYTLSYRDYVTAIVTRYKDEPTVLAWTLVNEADTSRKVTINGKQQSALVGFASDMSAVVKSIDKNHLLTVGTQSNGASGATGQDFIDVYGLRGIDFATAHDWGYWGNDEESIAGGVKNADGSMSLPDPLSPNCLKTYQAKIGCSLAQATQILKKPIVFTEVGIAANEPVSRARRADLMDKKMSAFFANQGAGYLYWQWNKIIDSQKYDVLPNTQDPLFSVMKKYAGLAILPLDGSVVVTSPPVAPSPVVTFLPTSAPTVAPTATPRVTPTPRPTPTATPATQTQTVTSRSLTLYRINTGTKDNARIGDYTWQAEQHSKGGTASPRSYAAINGTNDDLIYQTSQQSLPGQMLEYALSLSNGTYIVKLHFAETQLTAVGQRVFDVLLEGNSALDEYDIFKSVGTNTADIKSFSVTVTDGKLDIVIPPGTTGVGAIAGIEVIKP